MKLGDGVAQSPQSRPSPKGQWLVLVIQRSKWVESDTKQILGEEWMLGDALTSHNQRNESCVYEDCARSKKVE